LSDPSSSPQTSGYAKEDPYKNFNFVVEIDGMLAAGYSEVSGLNVELNVERRNFGGENDVEYKFLKPATYSDLILKKGISESDYMWNWYEQTIKGQIHPRNGSIYLHDPNISQRKVWNFFHAYPIKWDGPSLNATANNVATHSMTLTYRQLSKGD